MNTQSRAVSNTTSGTTTVLERMRPADVEQVLKAEQQIHAHPWSEGNFKDSLASGYEAWVLRQLKGEMLGYLVMQHAVDEAHVLNVAVVATQQGKGWGASLLNQATEIAKENGMASLLLEVRPSNARALALYRHYGFVQIGIRKNYYPTGATEREDAIVMRLVL